MPKPFLLGVEVQESALGNVMRRINALPGVVNIIMDFERRLAKSKAMANGELKARKAPVISEITGEELILATLYKRSPQPTAQLRAVFVGAGRSASSVNSVSHTMRKRGDIIGSPAGWSLSKKLRDRLRSRKANKR